jgi:hypothetical protein
LRSVGTFF